ncbi:TVP38/TMEM64 family protein [Salidesulfovibrio onnuriiensis]|uniref:TVP38/TMEM64 family protein n=1 Tax=Salidesulfovibrio onnuriiensis TaxID=2583823 RepID=UPI0011CB5AC7|nr:TVP38/TMEM64 family protein [Salidesulfovibrio onnuriiensis]
MKADTGKRLLMLAVIAVLVACYFLFDLGQYLTLEYFKASRDHFTALYETHKLLVLVSYFVIYVISTALAVPGALALSLAGAALFGFWTGLVVISFASSIGASLSFLVSRYLLRDWVQNRFGDKLVRINRGIEEEGAFYLFTLRLIPAFPFFAINLVMGLTPMRLVTYYWVSQVGMLPGTMVFVNAGKELGKIESLSGLISPSLLISFALLGLFPLVTKKVLGWYKTRKGE